MSWGVNLRENASNGCTSRSKIERSNRNASAGKPLHFFSQWNVISFPTNSYGMTSGPETRRGDRGMLPKVYRTMMWSLQLKKMIFFARQKTALDESPELAIVAALGWELPHREEVQERDRKVRSGEIGLRNRGRGISWRSRNNP